MIECFPVNIERFGIGMVAFIAIRGAVTVDNPRVFGNRDLVAEIDLAGAVNHGPAVGDQIVDLRSGRDTALVDSSGGVERVAPILLTTGTGACPDNRSRWGDSVALSYREVHGGAGGCVDVVQERGRDFPQPGLDAARLLASIKRPSRASPGGQVALT